MAAGSARRQPPSAGRCRGSRPADRNAGLVHVRTSGVVLLVSPGWRHRPQRRDRGAGVIGGRSAAFVLTVRQGRRADIEACARIVVADPLWRLYRALGYRKVGDLPHYVVSGMTERLYRKTRGPIESKTR